MKISAGGALLALLALGGCAVASETPLFTGDALRTPGLAEGRWAFYGAGCDVQPHRPLPECAMALSVKGGVMRMPVSELLDSMNLPPPARAGAPIPTDTASKIDLVKGDPEILQLTTVRPSPPPQPQPGFHSLPVNYWGLRTKTRDPSGAVTDAVIWAMVCPKPPLPPGVKAGLPCAAETPMAVRALAPHMKPMTSFYMTWIDP